MNLIAPPNRVLVVQDTKVDKIGSLFVPQGKEDFPPFGVVISIGSKIERPEFAVGDRVMFKRRAHGKTGGALNPDERDRSEFDGILCLHGDDILAVILDA